MSRFRSALILFVVSTLCVSPAWSEPYAYVTNRGSATVSIIDTQTDKVTSTFAVVNEPLGIAASADGARLYVVNQTGTLIERDLYEDKETARMTVGAAAAGIWPSPDGRMLLVALGDRDAVALIDMPTLRMLKTLQVGGKRAEHAVFSPDGRWVYASAKNGDSIAVIDVAKRAVVKSIGLGGEPGSIAFAPDGSRAYAAVTAAQELVVIDVARHAVAARVKPSARPNDIIAHPDGKRVFVGVGEAGKVQVLDVQSGRSIATAEAGAGAAEMALTPDGRKLYVLRPLANSVAVIDASSYRRIADVATGPRPSSLVISRRPSLPREGG